ncbi:MAG: hypothetical protein LBD23_01405 [Oscillospiraceae bacterium]|jgi:hypothetical protein|nr:hypothetical protein [Oscillospiraceae bacterium]
MMPLLRQLEVMPVLGTGTIRLNFGKLAYKGCIDTPKAETTGGYTLPVLVLLARRPKTPLLIQEGI